MRLVTWNVNSLKARAHRLDELLADHDPDVVCLQETKGAGLPEVVERLDAAGYRLIEHHSGGRNGVAVVVRSSLEVTDEVAGLADEPIADEARWVEAVVEGTRVASVYVPNGREVDSVHYDTKLAFLEAMAARVAAVTEPMVVAGDVNVAPEDVDVWDPELFVGATHVTPDERAALNGVLDAGGLVDAFRRVEPSAQVFTWWDYRGGAFHKNQGLRIDLIMVSSGLADGLSRVQMLRDLRKGSKPSDHAPLLAEWS